MGAFVVDIFEFCRLQERREGEIPVADLGRLSGDAADQSGTIRWVLQGGNRSCGHAQMVLAVTGVVKLTCQRCLTSFDFGVNSEAVLVLAPDEESIEAIEEVIGDESIDVIVGSHAMSVVDLIEDEALLSLPLSPRHDVCPGRGAPDVSKRSEKESPFAVLKGAGK